MTTKIRPMTQRDKPAIIRILTATPEFKPSEVVVAEVDRLAVGYICYGPTPLTEGTWDIYWIAVAQGEQSRGVGSALIALAEDEIKKAQGRLAIIETSSKPEYEKTRRFHNRQGYELIGRIPDFYAPGDDKLILQKRLR